MFLKKGNEITSTYTISIFRKVWQWAAALFKYNSIILTNVMYMTTNRSNKRIRMIPVENDLFDKGTTNKLKQVVLNNASLWIWFTYIIIIYYFRLRKD